VVRYFKFRFDLILIAALQQTQDSWQYIALLRRSISHQRPLLKLATASNFGSSDLDLGLGSKTFRLALLPLLLNIVF
jgi:hypothetical protein